MIAFYYGLTGFACVIYYRRHLLDSARNFVMIGLLPLAGGLMLFAILVKSCVDLSKPENSESGDSWLGVGPPLLIGGASLVLGVLLMLWWYLSGNREFFRRRPEVVDPAVFASGPAGRAEV